MLIEDGTGKGYIAKVGDDNKLHTFSLIEYPMEAFSHTGDAYTIATNFISLTNIATYSGMLYINETSTSDIVHIEALRTASTSNCLWQLYRNPTAGTLISAGTVVTPTNLNFSSGKVISATSKIGTGGVGLTVTDGTLIGQWMTSPYNAYERLFSGAILLGTGNTVALVCLPSANPTNVSATITVWEESLLSR